MGLHRWPGPALSPGLAGMLGRSIMGAGVPTARGGQPHLLPGTCVAVELGLPNRLELRRAPFALHPILQKKRPREGSCWSAVCSGHLCHDPVAKLLDDRPNGISAGLSPADGQAPCRRVAPNAQQRCWVLIWETNDF